MSLALIAAIGALAATPSEEVTERPQRKNVIVFQSDSGGVAFAYTRAFSETASVTVALGVTGNISDIGGSVGIAATSLGAGLDLALTQYLVNHAPVGPWLRVRMGADYQQFSFGPAGPDAQMLLGNRYALRSALLLGFTAIVEPGFTIQLAAGPEVLRFYQRVDQPTGPISSASWNLQARTELGVGWSF